MIARVVLALDSPTLQRQLKKRLADSDVFVDELKGRANLWERLSHAICDLIVISRSRLPPPAVESVAALGEMTDSPAVVVVSDLDDEADRAQLLAAGCRAVLKSALSPPDLLDVLDTVLASKRAQAQQLLATQRVLDEPRLSDFVSNSPAMQAFVAMVQRVVDRDVSLLILGETGVGKGRLAQAIHYEGRRAQGPFIGINCGALPETLLESELFGHEEGAFTGATRSRRGCFELAHRGTVFLDEIGDIPPHVQVRLLHVLQEREVRRVGGERPFKVDVRIMAATNRDLHEAVEKKLFREDLYFRLSVMTLEIPPLRQRREDIAELTRNYVDYLRPRVGADVYGVSEEALQALYHYSWPGNIRELINVVERAMMLCSSDQIELTDLPAGVADAAMTPDRGATDRGEQPLPLPPSWLEQPWRDVRQRALNAVERTYLIALLQRTRGRIGEAADLAGMRPRSLFEKMQRHGLRKETFRKPPAA